MTDQELAKKARAVTGLSQDKFSAKIKVSAATIRNWEQGIRSLDAIAIFALKTIIKHHKIILD